MLRHAVRRGQGASLQTAIDRALCTIPDLTGVVTADPDSRSEDEILRFADSLRDYPDSLILGSRKALRGIPARLLPALLQIQVPGELEAETLVAAHRFDVPIREVGGTLVGRTHWSPAGTQAGLPGQGAKAAPIAESAPPPTFQPALRLVAGALRSAISQIRLVPTLFAIVFAVLLGVEIHGFRTTPLFAQTIWSPIGIKRFIRYGAEFLAFAVPLLVMVPWTFAGFITALLLVLTAISMGPLPLLAVSFFLVSCNALGSLLLGRTKSDSVAVDVCATLLGTGVYVFLMTLIARVAVNYSLAWGILLSIPVAADIRRVSRRLAGWASRIASVELRSPWERISFALLVFILGAQWFVAMLPEVSADGLAMHLAIPMNIAANHRMTFEPARYLWSVMPMGADWLYTIVFLLGGEYAARILNFAMLLVIVALVYRATRRWVTPAAGFLLAASLVATPVVQYVTGALFVENYLVALVLGFMTAIWHFGETGNRKLLYVAMATGGAAMATKYGALVFILLALPFAGAGIARHRKSLGVKPATVCAIALLLLVVTTLPTYLIAYEKTGNPIFPFLNPRIHSPLLNPSVLIADARFRIPVSWTALYTLTFHTSKAYEGQDGGFGFQYLMVAPLALLGLLVARSRPAQGAAVLAIGGGLLIIQSTPNVRYLYTSMPFLLIAFAGLLGWMSSKHRGLYRVLIVYLFAATALNTYFLPASNYYHKDFCLRLPFSRTEKERYREKEAPIRSVIAYYNLHHPNSAVLLTSTTATAGLTGDIFLNNWHQFPIVEELRRAHTPLDMFHLMQRWKVGYFIVEKLPPTTDGTRRPRSVAQCMRCAGVRFRRILTRPSQSRLCPARPSGSSRRSTRPTRWQSRPVSMTIPTLPSSSVASGRTIGASTARTDTPSVTAILPARRSPSHSREPP